MSEITPQQMRELADKLGVATRTRGTAFTDLRVAADDALLALRTAAIRLEIDDAMVERAARAMFEGGAGGEIPWTWDDLVREDGPERATVWRDDARAVLEAAIHGPDDTAPQEDRHV